MIKLLTSDFGAVSGTDCTSAWTLAVQWLNGTHSETPELLIPTGLFATTERHEIHRTCVIRSELGVQRPRDYSCAVGLVGSAGFVFAPTASGSAWLGPTLCGAALTGGVASVDVPGTSHQGWALESRARCQLDLYVALVDGGVLLNGDYQAVPSANVNHSSVDVFVDGARSTGVQAQGKDANSLDVRATVLNAALGVKEKGTLGASRWRVNTECPQGRGLDIRSAGRPKLFIFDESRLPPIVHAPAVIVAGGTYHPPIAVEDGVPADVIAGSVPPTYLRTRHGAARVVELTQGDAQGQAERLQGAYVGRSPLLQVRAPWQGQVDAAGDPVETAPWLEVWSPSLRVHHGSAPRSLGHGVLQVVGAFLGPLLSWVYSGGWRATVGGWWRWASALSPHDELCLDEIGAVIDGGLYYLVDDVAPDASAYRVGDVVLSSASNPSHLGWRCCLEQVSTAPRRYRKIMRRFGALAGGT